MTSDGIQAIIGAGSNLGDRLGTLRGALQRLAATPGIVRVVPSSVYATAPVGLLDQPEFLNLVAGVQTLLSPESLLSALQAIELEFGRERTVRWGPRTLDLDLLLYVGETRATAALQLPHPRMWERAFVTTPLRELLAHPDMARPSWDAARTSLPPPAKDDAVRPLASLVCRPTA